VAHVRPHGRHTLIAGTLALGFVPALVGLIFVLPWLGHASWRLYRRVIA